MKQQFTIVIALLLSASLNAAQVDTISIQSSYLHKASKTVVITPTVSKTKGQHFPVVYLLHGYGGSYANWIRIAPQLAQKSDELGIIIVSPDGGKGSWYFDSPIDTSIQYESYITKELLPYVDEHYPTVNKSTARAITGLSMGGHGGLFLSIRHTDLFGAAGSMSGGVDFRPFPDNWDIKKSLGAYATNKQLWDSNVVVNLIQGLRNKQLDIIVDCGVDDFFLQVNRDLHKKLIELKIDHDYIERPGAHNGAYWNNSVDYQLLYFKKYFDLHI